MSVVWKPDPTIGVDLRLSAACDLAVSPTGDLDLVGNAVPIENIWQATILRLITTLGTYFFEDGYGTKLRQFVDAPMTATLQRQIETEISTTVLTDPRVKQIAALTVTQTTSPSGYQIAMNIITSSSQTIGGTLMVTGG
jgi:phage baseplate assembly protein W